MRPLRREMQIVFQDPFGSLNPRLPIGDQIEEGLVAHAMGTPSERKDRMHSALELVGAAETWRALSLSPARTLASLLAALSALTLLVMTATLAVQARWRLLMVTAAAGLITLVLGAAQLSGGTGNPFRLFDPNAIWLTGFQANHNSTADLILIAMLAMAALARLGLDRGLVRPGMIQTAGTVLVADGAMVLGLFLTGSRAGLGLLPLVLALQYLILQPDARLRWGRLGASAAGAVAMGGLAFVLLRDNRAIQAILARFTLEGRAYLVLNGRDVTAVERERLERRQPLLQVLGLGDLGQLDAVEERVAAHELGHARREVAEAAHDLEELVDVALAREERQPVADHRRGGRRAVLRGGGGATGLAGTGAGPQRQGG